jgi:hypothetical protein
MGLFPDLWREFRVGYRGIESKLNQVATFNEDSVNLLVVLQEVGIHSGLNLS